MDKCPKCNRKDSVYKKTKECKSCYSRRKYLEAKARYLEWKVKQKTKGLLVV